MRATATAPSNIAFIKYWGKKDEALKIPMNPSISMTLDETVSTTTTVDFSHEYEEDIFFLNEKRQQGKPLARVNRFLDTVRMMAGTDMKAQVISTNSFPTGAGMASSASGFAALATACSRALELNLDKEGLSALARQGSGSAARSVHGGFVQWQGDHATQLHGPNHWPQLRDIIVLVDDSEKKVSSTVAMKKTVEESSLFDQRISTLPERIYMLKEALANKDFALLAQTIMEDSDSMHRCIEEVGIQYLNDASRKIMKTILNLNKEEIIAAYTFDAGPNAHIITTAEHISKVTEKITRPMIVAGPGKGI